MKTIVWPALFWLLLLSATSAASPADFSVPLIGGGEFSLRDYRNKKPVLLKFWATWCRACLRQMPDYTALHEQYGERVQFLSVNVAINDPRDKVRAAVREFGLKMPVTYDKSGALWNLFGVMGTPMYLLIDNAGSIVFRGYHHDKKLEAALKKLAPARPAAFKPPEYLADIDGRPVLLNTGKGETLVAYHFATWCESYLRETDPARVRKCRDFGRGLQNLARDTDIRLVGFASRYSSDRESVLRYRQQNHIEHPLVFDEDGVFTERFGVRDFPFLVLLRNNEILLRADHVDTAQIERMIHTPSGGNHQ